MSLYDGLSVETAPIPEMTQSMQESSTTGASSSSDISGWSSGLKLMASQLQRNKKASKAIQQRSKPQLSTAVLDSGSVLTTKPSVTVSVTSSFLPMELHEDDLAVEIQDEYDPMVPNSYEQVLQERREERAKAREERRKREERGREERGRDRDRDRDRRHRRRRYSDDSNSGSDDERRGRTSSRRKDAAAIPPPMSMGKEQLEKPEEKENNVVRSALEELSKTKAKRKVNPFAKPKFGAVASKIMSKYGWEEGQGLGKKSQGISTALSVEKTSKRGGKIVNMAAEQEQQFETEKKKVQSLADVMKNPTKVILLQNMVGPGDVDEELEPEVAEECTKYGEVSRVVIFEIPHGVPEDEAVRIFVSFTRMESAIKAVIDLNGRFFGGRTVKGSFFSEERFANLDLSPQ